MENHFKYKPRVSIGMPLYNAEALVTRALDALLGQTFADFELIISDNASTDRTWAICQSYAQRDSRIRLYKNDSNLGVIKNFQRVLNLAQGEYFMWAAHDDFWKPEFLSMCVDALDNNPDAILAFTGIQLVREYAEQFSILHLDFHNQSPEAWRRVIDLLNHPDPKNSIFYGLYRHSLLERVGDTPFGLGADILWLLKCTIEGSFIQLEPVLFITYVEKRHIRSRLHQHTGAAPVNVLTLIRLDWLFISQLLTLTQRTAPDMQARIQLFRTSFYEIWRKLGWPLSLRLFTRYAALLIPQKFFHNFF